MVAFSLAVSISTLLRTSSHLATLALMTLSKSQVGISLSAFAHAWSVLMNDTPNRESTVREEELSGKEKLSRPPACVFEGDEV